MTLTPNELAASILGELGDTEETIWTTAGVLDYIEKALYDFKMRTLCSWKRMPLNNIIAQATYPIPDSYNFHQLDRAEEDYWAVNAIPPRVQMATNGYFETTGNRPLALMMEGDGLDVVRKIGVPTTSAGVDEDLVICGNGATEPVPGVTSTPWSTPENITMNGGGVAGMDVTPNQYSEYLVASDFDFDVPAEPVEVQAITIQMNCVSAFDIAGNLQLVKNGTLVAQKSVTPPPSLGAVTALFTPVDWGSFISTTDDLVDLEVRFFFRDSSASKAMAVDYIGAFYSTSRFIIEFYSTGAAVASIPDTAIDLPRRYLTYIAYRCKAEAYSKDGDGQSLKLAAYWDSRYEDAIGMLERRRERFYRRRISNIGHDGRVPDSSRRRDPGTLPAYFPKIS